jgi:arsenate reductase
MKKRTNKIAIAYVCIHNSCRSQMAEAITKILACDFFIPYSGGTETKPSINQDAVRIVKQLYNYDMNLTQTSKLIETVPAIDILITMGCNVECPFLPCIHREDWGLDDPTGKNDEAFIKTANIIKEKLLNLRKRIENGSIKIK